MLSITASRGNKTAWMTGDIFKSYISWFEEQMRLRGKDNVLLIMDNAPTHTLDGIRLRRTKVAFFPPNVTSVC